MKAYQNALIFTSLSQRNDVADNQLGDCHESTAANSSERTEDDQLQNGLRQRRRQ